MRDAYCCIACVRLARCATMTRGGNARGDARDAWAENPTTDGIAGSASASVRRRCASMRVDGWICICATY